MGEKSEKRLNKAFLTLLFFFRPLFHLRYGKEHKPPEFQLKSLDI